MPSVEIAAAFEGEELVSPADMNTTNETLRYGHSATRPCGHLRLRLGLFEKVDLGKGRAPRTQKRLG